MMKATTASGRFERSRRNGLLKRAGTLFLAILFALPQFGTTALAAGPDTGELTTVASAIDYDGYFYYIQDYAGAARPDVEVGVELPAYTLSDADVASMKEVDGTAGLFFGDVPGLATWEVEIPEDGLYSIQVCYYTPDDTREQVSVGLRFDGELPYTEANSCILTRCFSNSGIRTDKDGNGLRPLTEQVSRWTTTFLSDQNGVVGELDFFLSRGKHTISLTSAGIGYGISEITLKQKPALLSYAEYRAELAAAGVDGQASPSGVLRITEGEDYLYQSDTMLSPTYDRSDPLVQPYDYNAIPLNVGGGSNWTSPGQWLSWEIEVPEDGYYRLGIKYKQTYLQGLFSSRRVRIDGEVPFEELDAVAFNYTDTWKIQILGDGGTPYEIYLTAGTHVISMENVVGGLSETISVLQTCVQELNDLYLSIMMITGRDPDRFRDYYLERRIPDIRERFTTNSERLMAEAQRLIALTGKRGSESVLLEDTALKLVSYAEDVESLTSKGRLTNFKSDLTSLSNKASSLTSQGLDIDYLFLASDDAEIPRATANFWGSLAHSFRSFIASFTHDETPEAGSVRVWIVTGRDQLQVVNDMITSDFTPRTGIEVELELAASASLLNAVASDAGPDVAINIDSSLPVNYAQRGALLELSALEGFDELKEQYFDGAFNSYILNGKTYAMPSEQSFCMMFVRTDIFKKLGIEVPTTWDELRDIAPIIQRNNLEIGLGDLYTTFLYQMGGTLYNDEMTEILFADQTSVEAFQLYTDFYADYDFPLTYSFENRFSTGEMPIGIANYTTYNRLVYFYPEIKGQWAMYPLPGTVREDGTYSAVQATGGEQISLVQTPASATASVIFTKARDYDAAWEFLKWWSDGDTQARFGNDLEAIMGPAARYATANVRAFEQLPWSASERESLAEQMEQLEVLPILPGNYYVTRGITNSFRDVVYDRTNVRELLVKWEEIINEELARKWAEYYRNNP